MRDNAPRKLVLNVPFKWRGNWIPFFNEGTQFEIVSVSEQEIKLRFPGYKGDFIWYFKSPHIMFKLCNNDLFFNEIKRIFENTKQKYDEAVQNICGPSYDPSPRQTLFDGMAETLDLMKRLDCIEFGLALPTPNNIKFDQNVLPEIERSCVAVVAFSETITSPLDIQIDGSPVKCEYTIYYESQQLVEQNGESQKMSVTINSIEDVVNSKRNPPENEVWKFGRGALELHSTFILCLFCKVQWKFESNDTDGWYMEAIQVARKMLTLQRKPNLKTRPDLATFHEKPFRITVSLPPAGSGQSP